jgi:hypothetical protein
MTPFLVDYKLNPTGGFFVSFMQLLTFGGQNRGENDSKTRFGARGDVGYWGNSMINAPLWITVL